MASNWRTTARMLATAAAASAVSKAADSVRRLLEEASKSPEVNGPVSQPAPLRLVDPTPGLKASVTPVAPALIPSVAAQATMPHEFGPDPVPTPARGVGFQNAPRATVPTPVEAITESPVIAQAPPLKLHTSASEEEITRKDRKKDKKPPKKSPKKVASTTEERGKHRRDRSAISGTVTSSRGRGLRGVEVSVVDSDEVVVSTTTSGASGAFIVEDLPAGTYRVTGADPDGDFVTGWIGGASFAKASRLKVKDNSTRRKADLRLIAAADIAVKVDRHKKSTQLGIRVTERGTGVAATGRISVANKLIGVELPLNEGRAHVTLFGPQDGSAQPPKKVDITYRGDKHTAASSQSTKLR